MDEDTKNKHIEDLFHEWLPTIHAKASNLHRKYPTRVSDPADLYHAGQMGLMAAFKDFDPKIAKAMGNNFLTYAHKKIDGSMQNHITGLHSFGAQGVLDPFHEQRTRDLARKLKSEQAASQADEPPPIPQEAKKPTPGRP